MAREFAKAWFGLFTDDDFAVQPTDDKWLYMVLLGQPALNYAGVQPINMRRWRKACRTEDQMPTETEIETRLARLEKRGYVFTDVDTGEVLVRSFIRRDGIDKQPNVLKSALRAVAQIESPKLAVVMLSELPRITLPTVKNDALAAELKRLLNGAWTHLEGIAEGFTEPFPEPFTEGFPRPGKTEPFPEGFTEPFEEGLVVVEVEVAPTDPALKVGGSYAHTHTHTHTREAIQIDSQDDRNIPPSPRCRIHLGVENPPPCRACAQAREANETWTRERNDERQRAERNQRQHDAQATRDEILQCDLCDTDGYRNRRPCDHDPHADERNKRGIAAVRASLAAATTKPTHTPTTEDTP